MHNLLFVVKLVDSIRYHLENGTFEEYRDEFMSRYYATGR